MEALFLSVLVGLTSLLDHSAFASTSNPPRPHRQSLDGVWTLSNGPRALQVVATVPGGVYSDLQSAGILQQDIFYRFNDEAYRWVAKENWTYTRSFRAPSDAKMNEVLVLYGVDTVADVRLNGHLLGRIDNMFVRHRFSVKRILKEGASNFLEVHFTSPVHVANRRAAEQAKQYVVPPVCPDAHYRGECSVNHLRKMQASFAWDWGPAFPSMGLWKSVHLETYDDAVLRDVGFSVRKTSSAWMASVRVHWEAGTSVGKPSIGTINATLTDPAGGAIAMQAVTVTIIPDTKGAGHTDITMTVPKSAVQPWWPNGYGAATLYRLSVSLRSADSAQLWDQLDVNVGFRTVELVQEPVLKGDPSKGLTFMFRVNGVPVFAKGSNWIPAHVLPDLGTDPVRVSHLLHSAKEANMNMLRVWGGGVYESDEFYRMADELGILIWQDMMFACAMYPTGKSFLRSVDTEVRQQYQRLNHHASIAIWAGNNENEAALRGDWYLTGGANFERYHRDYIKLYVDTVRAALREEGITAPFAVSSPSNGAESEAEDFLAKDPYSSLYGDDHHYDYISDAWRPAVFHHTRFGSEYGFMSWPRRTTMMTASDSEHADEDLALGSALAEARQHHPGGNLEIVMQIMQHLPMPRDFNESKNFDKVAYLSQIYQAMATKTETEFLRRSRNLLTPNGEGRTMGALYWQLNDVWQAPSWAGIDSSGRWKMLHHFAVEFFAPLVVSPHVDGGVLAVDVVTDAPYEDVLLVHTDVLAWNSFVPRFSRVDAVRLRGAGSSPRAWAGPMQGLMAAAGCGEGSDCIIRFRLTGGSNTTAVAPDNHIWPRSPKNSRIPTTTFQVEDVSRSLPGTQHQKYDYSLRLKSTAPAAFVWLEAGPITGRFSRNGFHILDAQPVELRFHTDHKMNSMRLARHIHVTALNGMYSGDRVRQE